MVFHYFQCKPCMYQSAGQRYLDEATPPDFHFWCKPCDRAFVNDIARQQHWEDSNNHLLTYCWDCQLNFETEEGLTDHVRNDHIQCEKCDRKFPHLESRITHWENASNHKDSYCRDCKHDFLTSDGLKQHWKVHQRHLGTYDSVCDLRFPNEQTCTEHVNADPVKHFVCVQHQLFCGSQNTLLTHYFNSKTHAQCVPCKLGFQTEQLRNQHYWDSQAHAKCIKCRLGLPKASMLEQHYLTSAVHVRCLSCNQGFNDSTDLEEHYWSSGQHASKCTSCRLGFLSPTELVAHFKTSHKHFYDEKCGLAFDSVELLREHYVKDKHHQYCKNCDVSFDTSKQLKDHWKTAEKHRGTYCARCNTHVNTQNALIMHKVLSVRHYLSYFLAGPPRHRAVDSDRHGTVWRCQLCKASMLSRGDLDRHLEAQDCHDRYPDVLSCFHCNSGFDRISVLIRHLDSGKCGVDGNVLQSIVKHLEEMMAKDDGMAGKLKVTHQLRIDTTKAKELIVKVSMNSM
ncbi:MAG: hypothetical protein Q9186_000710 [Xanthomendoza sp. 1 TL-2023]